METTQAPRGYQPGGAFGACDRCAYKKRHYELRKEWTGLYVCPDCYDPRPADLSPPNVYPEGVPIRNARPDPGDLLGPNTTDPEDLKP